MPDRCGGAVALHAKEPGQLLDRVECQDSTVIERERRLVEAAAREHRTERLALGQDHVPVGAVVPLLGDAGAAQSVVDVHRVRLECSEPQLLVVGEHLEVLLEAGPSRFGGVLVRDGHTLSLPRCQK